jgi:peptide/nickel transport system substrate-binding protein
MHHRSPTSLIVRLFAIGTVLLLGAAACSSGNDEGTGGGSVNQAAPVDEGPPVDGGTLRVAVGAEPDMLYPIEARWSLEGNLIGSAIYDTLMTFDEDRNVVPRLAESMTPNADGTVWTIKLRPDVEFHDGTPFDAEAVKLNIEARQAVAIAGEALKLIDEVAIIDPLTVEVRMSGPWFGYDFTVAQQGGYMVAPSQINDADGRARNPVGTGPFKINGQWNPGTTINLVRNESYWSEPPHLEGIEFEALVDQTARAAALRTGDVDMILTQDPGSVASFRSTEGIIQVEDFAAEETIAMLNLATPPLDNRDARLALAYATDRTAVNEVVGGGLQSDANQPYTEGEQYYVDDAGYPDYDIDKAIEHVQAYETATGQPLALTLTTPSSNQQQQEAELLQAQWTAAGIDVQINTLDQSAFIAGVFVGDFQAAMFRNFAYVNPDSNYIFWHSSFVDPEGGINFGGLSSPALDAALDTARATQDEETRRAEYQKAVRAINEEVGYVWLYHNVWGLAATDQVGGLSAPQRLGFARQDGKPWWPDIWLKP